MGQLHSLDLVVIVAYALAMMGVGYWSSRRQNSLEEYFLAGRGVRPIVAGISMIATLLSTISYLTVPGELLKNGPGLMWSMAHIPISFLVVGYFVIPRIMKTRVTSAYELLEARFGMNVRQTASAFFVLVRLPWMAFIIYTCSYAVASVTGIRLPALLAIIGVVTTLYTVKGGIRAVIITDVAQFVILFGGALLTIGYVMYRCGPSAWWPDFSSPQLQSLHWPVLKVSSLNPFDRVTISSAILTSAIWWIAGAASDQIVIQRYLCTRDAQAARRCLLHCLLADCAISTVLWLVGIALLTFFMSFPAALPNPARAIVDQADDLFPHFIGAVLPAGLGGLVVAALLAAAMSSLSSGINSIGTVLLTDFPKVFARDCAGQDTRLMFRAKVIGLIVGAVAMLMSFAVVYVPGRNLFEVGFRTGDFFSAPLCVLFLLSFFVPFSTPAGAWAAIIVGFVASVTFSYWKQIVSLFVPTGDFSIILIQPMSLLLSLLAGVIVSLLSTARPAAIVPAKQDVTKATA